MVTEGESTESTVSGVIPDAEIQDEVNVNVRCSSGSKFSIRTNLHSQVGDFKALLARNCDVPAEHQRLIYKGRILKDDQSLHSYGLQADHTVHMVQGSAPVGPKPPADISNTRNTNTTSGVAQNIGSSDRGGIGSTGLGASLFGALGSSGGAGDLFGAGLPDFEQMQQQLTQNPNMMREIMNVPGIQNLMNNPDLMRGLIMNNPQMREIIDRNPELGHILNDPGILRQTLEAARNPELMREMMRNTDRAMSNIESSPEGFNMLRRMYENVQEPFLNATTTGRGTGNDLGSNPFAALLGSQGGGAQSRDVPNHSSNAGTETASGTAAPNANPLPNPWSSSGDNAPRSNSTGNARTPGVGGLGGLGLPEQGRIFGTPDPSTLNQVMQNPAVSQMMQNLLSNPQHLDQILGFNPQLRSMLDMNPQLREMMRNPEILRHLTSPDTMQQMMGLQQQLSQLNRQQPTQEGAQSGGTTENNMGLEFLTSMFGGPGVGGLTVPSTTGVPPEELYATQLSQLQEMGFFDTEENIRALRATSGNVHAAVERLLGNLGQ